MSLIEGHILNSKQMGQIGTVYTFYLYRQREER
mgnify:CR=1 FL=1